MIVDCAVYEAGRRRPGELPILHACEASRQDNAFVWIGLYEPTEEEFEAVRREFDLHELAVEDAIHAHQRPKLEVYGETLVVVRRSEGG
jgi:magnesium transporter